MLYRDIDIDLCVHYLSTCFLSESDVRNSCRRRDMYGLSVAIPTGETHREFHCEACLYTPAVVSTQLGRKARDKERKGSKKTNLVYRKEERRREN